MLACIAEWFCNSCQATEGGRPGAPLHEPQVESLPQQGLTSKMDEFQAAAALLGRHPLPAFNFSSVACLSDRLAVLD